MTSDKTTANTSATNNYHYYPLLCTGQLLVHPFALLSFFIPSVFMLFCLISLHYVNGISKVVMMMMMMTTRCAVKLWYMVGVAKFSKFRLLAKGLSKERAKMSDSFPTQKAYVSLAKHFWLTAYFHRIHRRHQRRCR